MVSKKHKQHYITLINKSIHRPITPCFNSEHTKALLFVLVSDYCGPIIFCVLASNCSGKLGIFRFPVSLCLAVFFGDDSKANYDSHVFYFLRWLYFCEERFEKYWYFFDYLSGFVQNRWWFFFVFVFPSIVSIEEQITWISNVRDFSFFNRISAKGVSRFLISRDF